MTAEENELTAQYLDHLVGVIRSSINLGMLWAIAGAGNLPELPQEKESPSSDVRIAVARDRAFCFVYETNLQLFRNSGAELIEFSPLADASLPECISGIYLPGGYPELFAERLADNVSMRESIAGAASAGLPIYAECGGMLYLLESLTDGDGRELPMAGVLPASASMMPRLQRVGYIEAALFAGGVLGEAGIVVRGHEFRYSRCEPQAGAAPAWLVDGEARGFAADNVVASYLHLNFAGCPQIASAFVAACRAHASARHDSSPVPETSPRRPA
jgi:cobyrinic acid a,c-diamide synthase